MLLWKIELEGSNLVLWKSTYSLKCNDSDLENVLLLMMQNWSADACVICVRRLSPGNDFPVSVCRSICL